MRKKTHRFKLNIVLWMLLLLPPLGFYLLWTAPRSRIYKISLTIAALLVYAAIAGAVWKSGLYDDYVAPPVPASGYCVERNHRGRYRIDRVLPFERQVFDEVVQYERQYRNEEGRSLSQPGDEESYDPESKAIATVAEKYGLDSTEILSIFMKVSSKMEPPK